MKEKSFFVFTVLGGFKTMWRFESVHSFGSVDGSRVFACGEDSRALRLVSKLPDLRAANADLHSVPLAAQNSPERVLPQPTQKAPLRVPFVLAGVAGFGPTNARVKVWCLTAWLYPNMNFCF